MAPAVVVSSSTPTTFGSPWVPSSIGCERTEDKSIVPSVFFLASFRNRSKGVGLSAECAHLASTSGGDVSGDDEVLSEESFGDDTLGFKRWLTDRRKDVLSLETEGVDGPASSCGRDIDESK